MSTTPEEPTQVVHRDASTGKFVSAEEAVASPDTTVAQTVRLPRYTDGRPHETWDALASAEIATREAWEEWLETAAEAGVAVAAVVDQVAPWIVYVGGDEETWFGIRPPTEDEAKPVSGQLPRILGQLKIIRNAENFTPPLRVWVLS